MSFLGIKIGKKKELLEEEGFNLIMEIITMAKGGHPYRHLLGPLKDHAERFPRVALLVKGLADNLQDVLPKRR